MSHSVLRAVVVLSTLAAASTQLHAQAPRLVIRMYDVAAAGPEVRAEAMRTAAAIVDDAGVIVTWMDCSRGGADHPCRTVPGARELVVRIMPMPDAALSRSRDALSIRAFSGAVDLQLGFAAVGDSSRRGFLPPSTTKAPSR